MLCRLISRKRKTDKSPVYLNVYDLTPINEYAYWLGLGIYHSGVQVHGIEYGFGAHEHSTTGVFEVEPKQCPGFTFRKSILIGGTDRSPEDVRAFMEKLSEKYSGNTYNLITNNCNHFCNDVCLKLSGKPIPRWVNRLARLGLFCNCVLPSGLNEKKIRQVKSEDKVNNVEKRKLRSHSGRYVSSSNNNPPPVLSSSSSSRSSSNSAPKNRRQRRCIPPSSSLIHASNPTPIKV